MVKTGTRWAIPVVSYNRIYQIWLIVRRLLMLSYACMCMCNLCIATKVTMYTLPVLAKQYAHMLT